MLHSLQPVACQAEMMRLVAFQRNLLELAILLANPSVWTLTDFQNVLGQDAGSWFLDKCKTSKGEWHTKFVALCNACALHYSSAADILSAFDNDTDFHNQFDNPSFQLLYPTLPLPIKDAIRPMMEHCYDYFVGETAFNVKVHGNARLKKLNRQWYLGSYVDQNRAIAVCPVCDGPMEKQVINLGTNSHPNKKTIPICQLDHFFPKSEYPFFSLHPYNLVPTCANCNQNFKGTKDPLKNDNGALASDSFLNTYYPFKKRAIQDLGNVKVTRVKPKVEEFEVTITDATTTPHRRIDTAARVFNLLNRWKTCLEGDASTNINNEDAQRGVVRRLVEQLSHQANIRREYGTPTQSDLLQDLTLEKSKCTVGAQEYNVLRVAYFDYALSNYQELEFLFKAYSGSL